MANFADYEGRIPANTLQSLRRYLENGIRPGNFLGAVLANDLFDSFRYGDDENLAALRAIMSFIYNELPMRSYPGCPWGSYEKVEAWIKAFVGSEVEDV